MIRFLIQRPIAVFMAFTAFFILGIITYLNIPVSLLPNIAIPEITVHITGSDNSARELENTVVAIVRQQLLQEGKLRDIRSETRDGNAIIRLSFEHGADTELAFIEVNEKIDAAMGRIPRDIDRPRVVKASATDIPVFNLNLTLKNKSFTENDFMDLCEFAETVIKRRIEQMPQVALVDMTGLVYKQVLVQPDENQLKITGITLSDIESALSNNNIEPGSMTVKDGHYEYNIKFSSVMRTIEDMRQIYIRKNDKIYQLSDLAQVEIVPEKERGMAYYNGRRAVTLSVIKQADENMDNLKKSMEREVDRLRRTYPDIDFQVSQNQTELLDYSISNLQQNLLLAFIFIWLVSALFMKDIRSPLIIGISMFVSLVISLLFFYLFKVSLNIVSLTGLILAFGNMIDSSIIVTDNIRQYHKNGRSIDDACVMGTNEVIAPMLSSSFTSISVFLPLIFLSGIAGAIFYDQAFSVTVGLLVSYITGIMLLPVLYKLVFTLKSPKLISRIRKRWGVKLQKSSSNTPIPERIYHRCINWIFKYKTATLIIMLGVFPLCYGLFMIIPKEKMPEISQNELIVSVEWNENIHVSENRRRVVELIESLKGKITENSALVGQQQYLLNSKQEQSSSESEIYLKMPQVEDVEKIKHIIETYVVTHFPKAILTFSPTTTIFERIFTTNEPELVAEYYTKNKNINVTPETIQALEKEIVEETGEIPAGISFQSQLNLAIDKQKIILYGASYNDIYQAVKTGFKENNFSVLRSNQQYLPIVLGSNEKDVREMINQTTINTTMDENGKRNSLPLSTFINMSVAEDVKTIVAGKNGEHIPFKFFDAKQPERIVDSLKEKAKADNKWDVSFSGTFFSNKEMIGELVIVLLVSILLMYFILAAQFESFVQPFIVLLEIPIDITASLALLILLGHSLNLMSAIGIVVSCGIIINDSILKVDIMNQLRKSGLSIMEAIHEAGRRRLNAILMTSLTSIVCMLPLFFTSDIGSELERPLAVSIIGGMLVGTPISLFVVPLAYWWVYRKHDKK
jgi:multidrug efflux pump subunit AcrB